MAGISCVRLLWSVAPREYMTSLLTPVVPEVWVMTYGAVGGSGSDERRGSRWAASATTDAQSSVRVRTFNAAVAGNLAAVVMTRSTGGIGSSIRLTMSM